LRLREWREQRRREKVGVVGAALVAEAMEQFREAARQELRRRGIPLLPAEQENAARE